MGCFGRIATSESDWTPILTVMQTLSALPVSLYQCMTCYSFVSHTFQRVWLTRLELLLKWKFLWSGYRTVQNRYQLMITCTSHANALSICHNTTLYCPSTITLYCVLECSFDYSNCRWLYGQCIIKLLMLQSKIVLRIVLG